MSALEQIGESRTLTSDLIDLAVGKQIGDGMSRTTYLWRPDPTLILKVEGVSSHFQNIEEWETWREVKDDDWHSRWFAPCEQISSCGTMLLMKRTELARLSDLPTRLPRYLTDFQQSNFGMFEGRFVCHDYGISLMRTHGMTKHMHKVGDWWTRD